MEAEIDRMKTLLSEAITTLCRNGLKYSQELSVEGLIGVTLDKKDIFLVSVKEIFCVPTKEDEDNSETRSQERVAKKRFGTSDAVKPKKLRKKGSSNERRVLETGEISSDSASEGEEEDKGSTTGSSLERGSQRRKSSDLIVIEDIDDIAIKREKHDRSCDESQLILPSEKVNVTEASRTYSGQTEEQDYSPSTDPRSEHPAGISVTDQKVFTQIVKQESVSDQSDQDLSMFTELSGEIIRMPHSLGKARSKPVPVAMNMVPGMSTDQGNCSQSEFPGSPSDWPAASASSEFPPLFGEGVTPQTPQASGSNQGASPQKPSDYIRLMEDVNMVTRRASYRCLLCDKYFTDRGNACRHVKTKHLGQEFTCPFCPFTNQRSDYIQRHIARKHPECETVIRDAGETVTRDAGTHTKWKPAGRRDLQKAEDS